MELFKLFGSILINSDEADASLANTDQNAGKVGDSLLKSIGSAAKWGAGLALAAGTAALAVVGLAVNLDEDLQKSLNGIEAATGYSKESMAGMEDTMLSIYNNNFGEDFADIGKAIEEVAKQTGATGKELEDLTTNALMVRDTFEFDVTESTRTAKMMMDQFGISGKDAYNLIAQGAQGGLDKNGDLLDTINEYSATFKAQGFTVEEMFGMLQNGAASGTFSVDKLGDAMKEFGIRSKDGSKASGDGFKALGLDAVVMTNAFGAGGDTAKAAFEKTTKALFEMKDPIAQEAAGVALFGTQWEDLGAKGIKALVDTRGEISLATDALKGINDVKYNTFGEAMVGIKRNLETEILLPISQNVLPVLSRFSSWFIENMPLIKENISAAMSSAKIVIDNVVTSIVSVIDWIVKFKDILIPLGAGIAAGAITFGIYTLAIKAQTLATTIAIKAQTLATTIATGATTAFGAVMAFVTSPIGIVVLAIGALIAIFLLAYNNIEGFRNIIDTAWSFIQTKTKEIFENYIMPFIRDQLMPLFKKVFSTIGDVVKGAFTLMGWAWDNVLKPVFEGLMWYINNILVPVWKKVFGVVGGVVKEIFTTIGDLWNKSLKPIFNGILDFVSGVFTGNWRKAWDGVVSVFKGIWEGMKTIAKAPINFIIGGLNGFIDGINKIKIPDWVPAVGGKGINIPNIPSFEVGTRYLPQDMLIQAHKGEMIVPKSENPYANSGNGKTLPSNSGLIIKIENFINNRQQDVQAFAEELEFYRKQRELGGSKA